MPGALIFPAQEPPYKCPLCGHTMSFVCTTVIDGHTVRVKHCSECGRNLMFAVAKEALERKAVQPGALHSCSDSAMDSWKSLAQTGSKHICDVELPGGIELEVWELPNSGYVGIDATYLEQVHTVIRDPYEPGGTLHDLEEDDEANAKIPVYKFTNAKESA